MAEEQDYFGHITVPDDETETEHDAANDVTFGDIGDVKAGDDISEALWKPNHFSFSSTIQAEKKNFFNQQQPSQPQQSSQPHSQSHSPSNARATPLPHAARSPPLSIAASPPPSIARQPWQPRPLPSPTSAQQFSQQVPLRGMTASPTSTSHIPTNEISSVSQFESQSALKQQPQIQTQPPPHPPPQIPPQTLPLQQPQPQPQRQPHPQVQPLVPPQPQPQPQPQLQPPTRPQPQSQLQPSAQALPPQQPTLPGILPSPFHHPAPQSVFPSAFPFNKAMSLDDYERNMIAFYEQQTRDALSMHEDRVAKQLQKALIAQRAGVPFDRRKFDRHQEVTRQVIMTDFYARVQQVRVLIWQHRQQQRHLLQQRQQQHSTPQTQLQPLLHPPTIPQQGTSQPTPQFPLAQQPPQASTQPQLQIPQLNQQPPNLEQANAKRPENLTPQQDKVSRNHTEPHQPAQPSEEKQPESTIPQVGDEKQQQNLLQLLNQQYLQLQRQLQQHQQQHHPQLQSQLEQQLQQLQQLHLKFQEKQEVQQLLQQTSSKAGQPQGESKTGISLQNRPQGQVPKVNSEEQSKENGIETDDNLPNQGFDLAASILGSLQDELDPELPPPESNGFKTPPSESTYVKEHSNGKKLKNAVGIYSKNRSVTNGVLENDPRMKEIERQMAQAGLGPSNNNSANGSSNPKRGGHRNRKKSFAPLFPSINNYRTSTKKTDRRLESMTDRDQELVFRVHLRQIESSAIYKDDYYSTVMSKERHGGQGEVFSELAEIVQTIRLSTKERGREGSIRSKKSKKSKQHPNGETEGTLEASPTGSESSSRPFANALGTVQSWNPRAPRRVMGSSGTELVSPESDEKTTTPMVDDMRVRMRKSIEDGYDVIAIIHDICRGESSESLEKQIRLLISTMHLREESGVEGEIWHSTRFFESMCLAEKGRRFIEHVIELLDLSEMLRFMPVLFANLGSMIFAVRILQAQNANDMGNGKLRLCRRMLTVLRDAEVAPADCLAMLQSFIVNHALEHKSLICALRSAVGVRLLYICLQRVAKGVADDEIVAVDVDRCCNITQFSHVLSNLLPTVFKGAASASSVWDVIGTIGGLLIDKRSQRQYRVRLSKMVRDGDIPSPPEL